MSAPEMLSKLAFIWIPGHKISPPGSNDRWDVPQLPSLTTFLLLVPQLGAPNWYGKIIFVCLISIPLDGCPPGTCITMPRIYFCLSASNFMSPVPIWRIVDIPIHVLFFVGIYFSGDQESNAPSLKWGIIIVRFSSVSDMSPRQDL